MALATSSLTAEFAGKFLSSPATRFCRSIGHSTTVGLTTVVVGIVADDSQNISSMPKHQLPSSRTRFEPRKNVILADFLRCLFGQFRFHPSCGLHLLKRLLDAPCSFCLFARPHVVISVL